MVVSRVQLARSAAANWLHCCWSWARMLASDFRQTSTSCLSPMMPSACALQLGWLLSVGTLSATAMVMVAAKSAGRIGTMAVLRLKGLSTPTLERAAGCMERDTGTHSHTWSGCFLEGVGF